MNEITKPNDILVSTLVNGNVDTMDLLSNGINAGNTQLLDPETYKESKLIQKQFTDKDGNFKTDEFNKAYEIAAQQYANLAQMDSYKKLSDYVEYNSRDLFAPINAKKTTPQYEIEKELNPLRLSHGVDSLFDFGKQTMSMRELAQQSKIWDSENQKWLDQTADERGILGSLFGQSLVYATYDEDTDEVDPLTGRVIHHQKGEWKLNDKGQYYTETIGNRSGYGKEFVAASDTLTKEGSALNKIDFFDSDDLEKSLAGTVAKTAVKIIPYLLPQTRMIFGGATAALEMAKVMPAFAKMIEGVVVGGDKDNETGFTRAMNSWENYFSKFEKSFSDKDMQSSWSAGQMLDQVADIFAQLYQMRAAGWLSTLAVKDPSKKAIQKFQKDFLPKFLQQTITPNSGISLTEKELGDIVQMAAEKMPEVAAAIKEQSKLSKALGVGYMALSSSADVYSDALAGGYDRRMAGAAGLAAAAGQYFIMTKEDAMNLGGWFLDSSVGYSEGAQRTNMLKALRPYYDEIAKGVSAVEQAASKEEKVGLINRMFGKLSNVYKEAKLGFKGGVRYLKNGVTEGTEEVVEEAIMDATKGIFDFLSWAGLGKNRDASFGVAEDFVSGNFLDRYLQNAIGGLMGGVLFEFQQQKVEPWMNKVMYGKVKEDVQPSLIHEIANGHTEDLYKAIDELASLDSDVAAIPVDVDGKQFAVSANGQLTRGQAAAKVLKSYVQTLEGVMVGENTNLTDDQILEKAVRDYQAISILKKGGLDKLLVADFTKLSSEIASIKLELDNLEKEEKESKDNKKSDEKNKDKETVENDKKPSEKELEEYDDGTYSGKSKKFLLELLKKKRAELQKFLNGEKAEFYTYKTLVGAVPEIKTALGDLSIYDYTFLKYGKEFKDLKKTKGVINQDSVKKEYDEWKSNSNADEKFIKLGVEAYQDFDKRFSKYINDYVQTGYGDVRKKTMAKLLATGNLTLNEVLDDKDSYQAIKKIANFLKDSGAGNVTLEDIFTQDELLLTDEVKKIIDANPNLMKLLQETGKTQEQIQQEVTNFLAGQLGSFNVDNLNGDTLSALINQYIYNSISESFDKILEKLPNKNLGELQNYLLNKGLISNIQVLTDEQKQVTDKKTLQEFFTAQAAVQNIPQDISIGLASSLLQKYIMSEDIIDGNVKQRLAQEACRSILSDIQQNSDELLEYFSKLANVQDAIDDMVTPFGLGVELGDLKNLIDDLNNNFGNKNIKDIVDEWALKISENFVQRKDVLEIPDISFNSQLSLDDMTVENIQKHITDKILEIINNDKLYKLYQEASKKQSKENTLYDGLSKIDLHLSESGPSKVLEILKSQHDKLRAAEKFEDYLPQGEQKVQLENALRALGVLRAIVIGKQEGSIGFGTPFAVNQQMKRFIEKNKIKSDNDYSTIDEDSSNLILRDISILENQIKGYLQLGENAYMNKVGQDAAIKKKFSKLLQDKINEKANAFTIHDFSLLPPENERAQYATNPEQALVFYAQQIYKNFNAQFKTQEARREAIKELIKNLNIDPDAIGRGNNPSNLNREVQSLTDWDLLNWIATALSADQREFYYRYNQLIVGNDKNTTIPLFSQEQAALQAWAFIQDEQNVKGDTTAITVHDAIIEELSALNPNLKGVPASRFFFINGITGAGKSTVVGSIISQLCSDRLMYVTAANKKQVDNYKSMIKKYYPEEDALKSGSIGQLLEMFFGKDNKAKIGAHIKQMISVDSLGQYYAAHPDDALFNRVEKEGQFIFHQLNEEKIKQYLLDKIDLEVIPEVILIDEATQVNQPTLQILNYLAKRFNIKIILSGDSTQRGAKFGKDTQAFNDLLLWRSAKLNVSIRSNNNQVGTNNSVFNYLLTEYEKIADNTVAYTQEEFKKFISDPNNQQVISYYQDDYTLNGYKFVDDLSKFTDDIALINKLNKEANAKNPRNTKKVMVITDLDSKGTPTSSTILATLAQGGMLQGDYEFFSPDDLHDLAVQGSEARYVIVDGNSFKQSSTDLPGQVLRSVYTFASRAQVGTLMQLTTKQQSDIGIRNRKDRITQIDEIPQLADAAKMKTTRKKELEDILGKYKPTKIELNDVQQKEVGDKKVYIRSTSVPKKETKSSTTTTSPKRPTSNVEVIDHDSEEKLSEEEEKQYVDSLNANIVPQEINEAAMNAATGANEQSGGHTKPFTPKTSVIMYPGMDHIGVKTASGQMHQPQDTGINFDMDGLFDQTRGINSAIYQGFIRFQHLLMAAKNKSDIVTGIKSDKYIAIFMYEVAPMVAYKKGINPNNWRISEDLANTYSEWFNNNVEIDPHYYVFAKKLKWEEDKPTTIANAKVEDSVGEGNTVLYYGMRLKSSDNYLNQYFSIGTMSKRTMHDGTPLQSQELQNLYAKADADLADKNFVAYELPNANMFDLDLSSTLWIRNIKDSNNNEIDWNRFESVDQMRKRGFDIDTDRIYLIDGSKVIVNGKAEYKVLALLAAIGTTSADINKYFEGKKLTYNERLEKLKQVFVTPEGKLRIQGSYLTFARFLSSEVTAIDSDATRSNAYNRIVFLNPKRSTAKEFFTSDDLKFQANLDKDLQDKRVKMALCRPASQTKMLRGLLTQARAFDDMVTLKKYLVGMRMNLAKSKETRFVKDKETLNKLIEDVDQAIRNGVNITPQEFEDKLSSYGHRILLHPFYYTFCYWNNGDLVIWDATKGILGENNGQTIITMDKKNQSQDARVIFDKLPDSYACPPLVSTAERTDVLDAFGYTLSDDIQLADPEEGFKMMQIAYNSKSGGYLGMYGYQLQAPTIQLQNEQLKEANAVTEPLEQLQLQEEIDQETGRKIVTNPRFPKRAAWVELPQKPVEFDAEAYAPQQLKEEDYIIDSSIKDNIWMREDKTKKEKVKVKDPKTGKEKEVTRYKKEYTNTYVEWKKDKNGKKTNHYSPQHARNERGFDIRMGDYVQLWGNEDQSYYVSRLNTSDPNDVKIILTHVGDPLGKGGKAFMTPLTDNETGRTVSIQAVTRVVKRTIAVKGQIASDYYRHPDKFSVKAKFESGKYAELFKTADTIQEMCNAIMNEGEEIKSLDFNKNFYYFIPIMDGQQADLDSLFNLYRNQQDTSNFDISVGGQIVDSVGKLDELNKDYSSRPGVAGYTLIRLYRKEGFTPEAQLTSETTIDKIQAAIIRAAQSNEATSAYVAHQVLFDQSIVQQHQTNLRAGNVSNLEYNKVEIAKNLTKPEDIIKFDKDGNIDMVATRKSKVKGIILTEDQVINKESRKFPSSEWVYEKKVDPTTNATYYEFFPRRDFIFRGSNNAKGGFTYNLNSEDPTVLTHDSYMNFIGRGKTTAKTITDYWSNQLSGYGFTDYQFYAYEPVSNFDSNGKKLSEAAVKEAKANKDYLKGVINKSQDYKTKYARKFLIISVTSGENGHRFVNYVPYPSPGEDYNTSLVRQVQLEDFIQQLGIRFEFEENAKRKTSGNTPVQIQTETPQTQTNTETITPESKTETKEDKTPQTPGNQDQDTIDLNKVWSNADFTRDFVNNVMQIKDTMKYPSIIAILPKLNYLCNQINAKSNLAKVQLTQQIIRSLSLLMQNANFVKNLKILTTYIDDSSKETNSYLHALLVGLSNPNSYSKIAEENTNERFLDQWLDKVISKIREENNVATDELLQELLNQYSEDIKIESIFKC